MEIKTNMATLVVVALTSFFIGKYKGKMDERHKQQEERLNNLEHLLNNF